VVANETLAIATGIDHGGVAHFTLAMMQSKKKWTCRNPQKFRRQYWHCEVFKP